MNFKSLNLEEDLVKIIDAIKGAPYIFLFLASLLSIPQMNYGQDTVVGGVVTDKQGTPVKNAKIIFLDPDRGYKFSLETDKKGKFLKVGIPAASYKITVQAEGYFPFESQVRIMYGVTEKMTIELERIPPNLGEDRDFAEGIDFFKARKYDEALVSFKKVIDKFPSNVEGYYNLGLTYLRKGDRERAIEFLKKAVELKPSGIEPYLALGESYFSAGDSERAEDNFKIAVELQPENPKAYYSLGIVYYKLDKTEEALLAFDKAIELNAELSYAYYQAGLSSIKIGDYKRAIKYFEDFLRLDPKAPEADQVKTMIEELKKRIQLLFG